MTSCQLLGLIGGVGRGQGSSLEKGAAVSWQPVLIAAEGVRALSQERKPGTNNLCQKLGEICDVCMALLNENQRLDLCFHVEFQGWF